MIRNSAKALVYQDGKLLLNSHLTSAGAPVYLGSLRRDGVCM